MCTLSLSTYQRGCKTVGGVEKIYIIDKGAREDSSVTLAVSAGAITIGGTGGTAYELYPSQNVSSFTQPRTDDNNAGTTYVTQTLEFTLHGYTAALVSLAEEIAKGRLEALVKMKNGVYFYAGYEANGLQSAGGDSGFTGASVGDQVGFTFTLTCESERSAPVAVYSEFATAFTINTPS